jgi:[ribosomal protein S5]-alanine N-acetyltransferase
METLESERILFRKLTPDDLDDLAALYADPDVMRYYPRTRMREETAESIKSYQDQYESEKVSLMAAIHKRENKFIGRCGIMLQDIDGEVLPEVGYMLDKFFWRGGLGSEAALLFRDFGFRELNFPKIISIIHPLNLASQGVAKNMGMTHERNAIYDAVDCQIYSITKETWEELQKVPAVNDTNPTEEISAVSDTKQNPEIPPPD